MTLDEAIDQAIALGDRDPLDCARKLLKRNGNEWAAAELAALAEDLIAERVRQRLSAQRRRSEMVLRPGDVIAQREMKLRTFPVPHPDGYWEYKPVGRVTEADLEARAAWYEKLARRGLVRAAWCRELIEMLRAEDVGTVGELRAELPPLPPDDEIEPPALRAA